ncbi:MAG: hypothetical protein QXL94_05480 [Candidatus Parvarchaeum sp.]
MGYEAQTSARADAVRMNEEKKKIEMPITLGAESKEVLDEIKNLTNGMITI